MWNRGSSLAGSSLMQDSDYRFAIKARIIKNFTRADGVKAHLERMYDILRLIFTDSAAGYPLHLFDEGMHIELGIGKIPTVREAVLLLGADILPIPQGVSFGATCWKHETGAYGFKGYAESRPMGDRAHPGRGAAFAERVTTNASS